jgi:hypothetical protein
MSALQGTGANPQTRLFQQWKNFKMNLAERNLNIESHDWIEL